MVIYVGKRGGEYVKVKGEYMGECNITSCVRTRARHFNTGTGKFYCTKCAHEIQSSCRDLQVLPSFYYRQQNMVEYGETSSGGELSYHCKLCNKPASWQGVPLCDCHGDKVQNHGMYSIPEKPNA